METPYVGPRPFGRGEPLYGREREVRDLVHLLTAERIVLLYSPSGAGKTSLIQAALIPALQDEQFQVLPIIRVHQERGVTSDPGLAVNRYLLSTLLSLDEARSPDQQTPPAALAQMSLMEYLTPWLDPQTHTPEQTTDIVLIFDQFEEIVTVDPTDIAAKHAFFAQVGATLEHPHCWALFAMREEFLAALDPFLRPIPNRLSDTFRLDLLEAQSARQAIQEPARQAGVTFTDAAATRLIEELRQVQVPQPDDPKALRPGPSVEPVQLQVVCQRLWQRLPAGTTTITEEQMTTLGDVQHALADYYTESVAAIAHATGVSERDIRDWCDTLIIEPGIRTLVQNEGLANSAIQGLVDAHLVRQHERRGRIWLELAHDRLVEPVRQNNIVWRETHLNQMQRQATLWDTARRSQSLLLRGTEWDEAEQWAISHADEISEIERDFLAACKQVREAEQRERRKNRIIAIVAVVAVIAALMASGLAVAAWRASQRAEQQQRIATSRQLATQSRQVLEQQADTALLLAVQATNEAQTVESRQVLLAGVQQTAAITSTLHGHTDAVTSLAFSPDGQTLASGSCSKRDDVERCVRGHIRLWDVRHHQQQGTRLSYHSSAVLALAFSPDGATLASASCAEWHIMTDACRISEVRLWEVATRQPIGDPRFHRVDEIVSLAFAEDGTTLLSLSVDGTLLHWEHEAGRPTERTVRVPIEGMRSATFSGDGQTLVLLGDGVRWWDMNLERFQGDSREPPTGTSGIALSQDATRLGLYGCAEQDEHGVQCRQGQIMVWDAEHGQPVGETLRGHTSAVTSLAISPDGHTLASGSDDDTIILWESANQPALSEPLHPGAATVQDAAITPQGQVLALNECVTQDETVACQARAIRLWDVTARQPHSDPLPDPADDVVALHFSPTGNLLALRNPDGTIRLWDVAQHQMVGDIPPGALRVVGMAFNPDETILAVAWCDPLVADENEATCREHGITLWDVATQQPMGEPLHGHTSTIEHLAFSPDGRLLASSACGSRAGQTCTQGEIILWAVATGQPLGEPLYGHASSVDSLVFQLDSQVLASSGCTKWEAGIEACAESEIILWDVATHLPLGEPLGGHIDRVTRLSFRPDGQMLAALNAFGTITLWDMPQHQPIGTLTPHAMTLATPTASAPALTFTPDGKHLMALQPDGTLTRWSVEVAAWQARACAVVNRNLTWREWRQYVSTDISYQKTCADLPLHASVLEAGHAIARRGDVAGATAHFEQVQSVEPDLPLDPQGEAERAAARTLLERGEVLARQGNLDAARETLAQAQAFDPSLNLDPDVVAGRFYAETLDERGETLARAGDIAAATAAFAEAQQLDPSSFTLDPEPREKAEWLYAETLVEHGETLASAGDVDGAIAAFREAKERDPSLRLDPVSAARSLASSALVWDALEQMEQGAIDSAIVSLTEAQRLDPEREISAATWNNLCWHGSLHGEAETVLDACDRAVALAPADGNLRESRAVARGVTGDYDGAVEDLQFYLEWAATQEDIPPARLREREQWLTELEAGRNPFDDATLEHLKTE